MVIKFICHRDSLCDFFHPPPPLKIKVLSLDCYVHVGGDTNGS